MPIKTTITSRDFYPLDINTDPGAESGFLAGNVGERLRMEATIEVSWRFDTVTDDGFEITISGTQSVIERNAGSWFDDGFSEGDYIEVTEGANVFTCSIDVLSEREMRVSNNNTTSGSPADGTFDVISIRGVVLSATEGVKKGVIYRYGFVENDDSASYLSPLTGQVQEYYVEDLLAAPGFGNYITMTPKGQELQWQEGSCEAQFVDDPASMTSQYVQIYKINHIFTIPSFWKEEYFDDLENGTIPEPFETGSYKYVFELEVRNTYNNPNTATIAEDDQNEGSVGYLNETYDGFAQGFQLSSIPVYTDIISNPADGILPGSGVICNFQIQKNSGNFATADHIGIKLFKCPTNEDMRNLPGTFDDIWGPEAVYGTTDGATDFGDGGLSVLNYALATINSGDNSLCDVELIINNFDGLLTEEDRYILLCHVESDGVTIADSDKTMILVDFNSYDAIRDDYGLIESQELGFMGHAADPIVYANASSDYKGWKQDTYIVDYEFDLVNDSPSDYDVLIDRMYTEIIAYNSTTEESFVLDSYEIPLGDGIERYSGTRKYQWFNHSSSVGFALDDSDDFNTVTLNSGDIVSDNVNYYGRMPMRMNWQKWISLPNADDVFIDVNELNNGLNKDASNYSLQNDYAIKTVLMVDVKRVNLGNDTEKITTYRIMSPDFDIRDYDDEDTGNWSGVIETFSEDGTVDYGGKIATNANTLMKITWSNPSGVGSGNFYAIHKTEPSGSPSSEALQELSSIRLYMDDNKLVPVDPDALDFLKVTINANDIVTECIIDYTKIDTSVPNNLSGRLGFYTIPPIVVWDGLTVVGTALGYMDVDMIMTDGNGGALTGSDTIRVEVKELNGSVLETVEGAYGADISVFTGGLGSGDSIVDHSTGLMQDAGTMRMEKVTWANAQTPPKINELAVKLDLGIQGELANGDLSNYDRQVIPYYGLDGAMTRCEGSCLLPDGTVLVTLYNSPYEVWMIIPEYEDEDNPTQDNSIWDGVGAYSLKVADDTFNATSGTRPVKIFYNETEDAIFGCAFNDGVHILDRANWETEGGGGGGSTWDEDTTPTVAPYGTWDALWLSNSRPVIWVMASNTSFRLAMQAWDGAAWGWVNFSSQIDSDLGYTPSVGYNMCAYDEDTIFFLTGGPNISLIRGTYSGTDRTDPTDWTFEEILQPKVVGTVIEGDGTSWRANWSSTTEIICGGVENGNPYFWIIDTNGELLKIANNGGVSSTEAENWDLSSEATGFGGSVSCILLLRENLIMLNRISGLDVTVYDVDAATETTIINGSGNVLQTRY